MEENTGIPTELVIEKNTEDLLAELSELKLEPLRTGEPDPVAVREGLYNEEIKQKLRLRLYVAGFVGLMLGAELWGLCMIVIWQGRGHFNLNEWAFTAIVNGILLQSFYSFRTIVTHLFPEGAKDFTK